MKKLLFILFIAFAIKVQSQTVTYSEHSYTTDSPNTLFGSFNWLYQVDNDVYYFKRIGGLDTNTIWFTALSHPSIYRESNTLVGVDDTGHVFRYRIQDLPFKPSTYTPSFSSITGKPTTLAGYGITDAYPLVGNPSGFLNGINSGQVITALGYTPYNATNPNSYTSNLGTVTSIGLTSSDFSISGSPITSSGNITANLKPTGVSTGTYDWVTVGLDGRVTSAGNTPLPTAIALGGRNFNQAYQLSSTRPSFISISAQLSCNLSLSGGQAGNIQLQLSANGSSGWITYGTLSASNTGTLTIGLNTTQVSGGQLTVPIPAGYYWRALTTNTTGTPTYTFNGGYEIVY